MSPQKKAAAATATQKITTPQSYPPGSDLSSTERIAAHRGRIPRQYRKVYDTAMSGRSLRAAVNSQCIECMGYDLAEVKQCCSPQCPLFPYRPLRGVSYGLAGLGHSDPESTNTGKGGH
jgi:hypothetical protein